MMKYIKLVALLLGALFMSTVQAVEITANEARTVAENFVQKDSIGKSVLPGRNVEAVAKRGGFYLVTLKPSGHILVSVNRSARPIPVFSESDFVEPIVGSPQAAFLAVAETNSVNATGTQYETQWKTLLGQKVLKLTTSSTTEYVNVAPMVTTIWGQSYPYYELSPVVKGSHTLVGCVATAYSQILRYWEWPAILNEDIATTHTAGNVWGYKWRLKAGTVFDWQDMPISYASDYATRLKLARGAMLAGMLAKMKYNISASAAQTSQPGINDWYTPYTCLDTTNSTQEERNAGMKKSLQEGCPFMVSIDTEAGGHAVVGDGWKESESGAYVRLNYGWQESSIIYYDPASPLGVYLYQKPNPMVQNKPMAVNSTLPVKVEWAFPSKGYQNTLSGFTVAYREVEDAVVNWTDNMSDSKGTINGDCIQVETIADCGEGEVLRIGTKADNETYTWPTMVATKDTVFSYDIHSRNALGMNVQIQLLDPTVGWTTITTPEISENSEIAWATHSINLGAYAGRGIAIRVKATTSGTTSYNDETARSTGVQFDNLKLTNVRQAKSEKVATVNADKTARSLEVSNSLVSGKTYLFQVTPTFTDETKGIPGYETSCKIVGSSVQKPTITSVESVIESAPSVQSGMYRSCYLGRNQFGVYCSAATTQLEAHLSHLSVTSEVKVPDAAFPGEYVTDYKCVSIEDAVTVAKKENGKFLVTADVSSLTTYAKNTGMILTLIARNDVGDIYQKDLFLVLTDSGSETAIDVANLPESGTISGGGGTTPSEPSTVYYSVSFASMGGTAVSQQSVAKGKAIGTLPTTTYDGYKFLGWFTEISGGTKITESTVITGNVIFFAQWQANTPAVTTYTVTFDPNGGSPEMSRFVNENAAVGTLPTTVTKTGYKLVGWFTAKEGGTKIDATQVITGNITYYAHWEVSSGGGDTPSGGADDDGSTRFCHGVSKTSGAYDVTRSGTWNSVVPVGYNLIYWWVDRYYEANGANPSDYVAPNPSSMPSSDGTYTIQSYTASLLNSALPTTLSVGTKREAYFPTTTYSVNDWNGTATGDDRPKAAGKMIYAALANGPIGVKVITSLSRSYGAVIWGCDYATDGNDKYATAVYITETTSSTRSDNSVTKRELKVVSTSDGNFTNTGLKDFNGSGSHGVIDYYYPITGVVITKPDNPVTTYTVTFNSDGGSAVSSIQVEKDSTIATLPSTVKSGYKFLGWFNGNTQLTTTMSITANITYTAHWEEIVVTPTVYTIVFDANGGSVDELSREVPCDTAVGTLPTPIYAGYSFDGWYLDDTRVDDNTIVDDSVVYVAHWTALNPTEDDPIGVADNSSNPGKNYTSSYGYEMYDNYWTARKRAIQEGRQLFILSGAAWCSNCAFVKNYLTSLGTDFANRFVVYYSDNDSTTCNCFKGGLPQYGAADPRAVDAFTGTLNGSVRSWDIAWQTDTSGIYQQDRGGYASERVDLVVTKGKEHALYNGLPTALVIRGLPTLGTGTTGRYELFAQFEDGTEMPVDYGVDWEVVSGDGTFSDANVDGRDVGALVVRSGTVVIRARSKFYFTGTKTMTVECAPESDIASVEILTSEVNLEDDATPTIEAEATLTNGKKIQVFGFGTWTATFKEQLLRTKCPELEENSDGVTSPIITIDNESRLNYALIDGLLKVCDQKIDVTLTVNGKTTTKTITVWGPTKVIASKWTMISGSKQTTLGVVRLNCTELTYNYGGEIKTTTDTYFATYATVLQCGVRSQVSYHRGLTVYVDNFDADRTYSVDLKAQKVNGKYKAFTPLLNVESSRATSITAVARTNTYVTEIDKGLVPQGFFTAFFPGRTDYATLADLDSDGDGFNNWEEYVLGTDPTNKSDAFTLMQGYQHLTAPAANGATMQYKVMYQQRAGRIYFIDGKKNWGDAWTQVASVKLANMDATDVTTFTYPSAQSATFADDCKFFRVRAGLCEHEFSYPDTMPIIAPNMLVAAPDSIIDLTNETLPMNLISFDTDATHAGTVNVVVPTSAQTPGTALISAPKAAKTSLLACKPKDSGDIQFEVIDDPDDATRMVLKVKGDAPVVYEAPFTFTISQNVNWSDIEWTDTNGNKANWATISTSGATAVTITGNAGYAITVDSGVTSFPATIAADSATTLVFSGDVPTGITTALKKADWKGAVKLTGSISNNTNLGNFGNAGSKIAWAATLPSDGYLNNGMTWAGAFEIAAGAVLKIANGSTNGKYTFSGKLTGTGTFETSVNKPASSVETYCFTGDTSEFGGTMIANGHHAIVFGDKSPAGDTTLRGKIIVLSGKTATIVSGKTWTAANGIVVDGTLNVTGVSSDVVKVSDNNLTINGTLQKNGVTVAQDQYLVSGGTITFYGDTHINVPEGATYTIGAAAFGSKVFYGSGTIKMAQSATSGKANLSDLLAAANFSDSFTGTIELGAGRYVYSTDCVPTRVKISVINGAQLYVGANVAISNPLTLAGNGWTGESNNVAPAALRLEGSASVAAGATVTVVDNAAIGVYSGTGTINGTIVAANGFRKISGGTLTIPRPEQKATTNVGTITVVGGALQLGNNSGYSAGSTMSAGTGIVVENGATLTLWAWTTAKGSFSDNDKVALSTPVTLRNGGKLFTNDGSYAFTGAVNVDAGATANAELKWQKGWVFKTLNIPADAMLNVSFTGTDSRTIKLAVDGGERLGTLKVANATSTSVTQSGTVCTATGTANSKNYELRIAVPEGCQLREAANGNAVNYNIIKYVAPFIFIIAENGNWSEMQGMDANGVQFLASELTTAEKAGATITLEATLPFV